MQNKMRAWDIILLTQLLTIAVECNNKEETKSKNPLPYFRRQGEEDSYYLHAKSLERDDAQSHLVSFLIDNLKEIFSENDKVTEFSVSPLTSRTTEVLHTKYTNSTTEEDPQLTDDVKGYRNISYSAVIDLNPYELVSPGYEIKKAKQSHLLLLSESTMKKSEQKLVQNQSYFLVSSLAPEPSDIAESIIEHGRERSCIFCNNVATEDCSDPKNKLIPSVICERDADQCYSLHTPFGIIDRGCFNVQHNLTVYVCACNLCNYIAIAEMPYFFSNKQEWVHNVVELSRMRNLRKSVLKDMACLKCEVNITTSRRGLVENENCLDGNIGSVPTQICDENEICAVKAIKSEGYIWRGCTRSPLYNYWWSVCDRDLCNYDSLVSVYDYL